MSLYRASFLILCAVVLSACGQKGVVASSTNEAYCDHPSPTSPIAGSTGTARVFNVDPMISANNPTLSPGSPNLDSYASTTSLSNLLGYGTLRGSYVHVLTDRCLVNGEASYGSYSDSNTFSYSHSDGRFAETMTYHYGNAYRAELDAAGALYPTPSFEMIANCDVVNNAYYTQRIVSGSVVDYVCIGHPSKYSTTNFADDSQVFVHELQHGTTGNAYSTSEDFNKLVYDEAGAINEAISDFTALIQAEPVVTLLPSFNAKDFSRWALGQFFTSSVLRGAAKCPVWTPDYPTCSNFNKTSAGFSASARRVSFAYPDGLGWPYAGPSASSTLKSVWANSGGFEEIHQTAPIITGALYDAYIAMKAGAAFGSDQAARRAILKLLMETIKALPKANASDPSPVTMPVFATTMISTMTSLNTLFDTAGKTSAVTTALADRGLTSIPTVVNGWASAGTKGATANHPGVFFYETSGTGNNRIQLGEKGLVWFDIENSDADSVAAPLLKVTISGAGGKVRFQGTSKNPGYVNSTTAFVRYGKINGSSYVAAVNNGTVAQNTGMTTDYFGTSYLGINIDTGLYIEVDSNASGTFNFTVEITSANSATVGNKETLTFSVTLS